MSQNTQTLFTPVIISPSRTDHDHEVPVVFDSPHSGVFYPEDFGHTVSLATLRMAEDTHVDKLYEQATAHGATLIAAGFPRS